MGVSNFSFSSCADALVQEVIQSDQIFAHENLVFTFLLVAEKMVG